MQLPEELQSAIEQLVEKNSTTDLRKAREELTHFYREGRAPKSIFNDPSKLTAYLVTRMPATYAAITHVLEKAEIHCEHLLDLGAGPGTASWAASYMLPALNKITLLEQSLDAINMGKTLARSSPYSSLQNATWLHQSLTAPIPNADVAILSYVLNEMGQYDDLIKRCWDAVNCLIIIEPGTPKGAALIRKVREQLIALNAHILAPCPHKLACPSDWCHFSARVERTRFHRQLKEGTLGHEDEKFSYLIAAKYPGSTYSGRILRHPLKLSGHVRLTVCADNGKLEEKVITRSDKKNYKKARDAEWGDIL